jgi:flavin-dependent dehydrogenase
VRKGDQRTEIGFRVLVAADGPGSRVAQSLGLPRLETVDTRQYVVPLLRRHGHTDIFLSADYPGGYAWLFPKGSVANLGLGLDTKLAPDLKAPLDALHLQLAGQGLVGMDILGRTGGPIGRGLRERLVVGNALFVGERRGSRIRSPARDRRRGHLGRRPGRASRGCSMASSTRSTATKRMCATSSRRPSSAPSRAAAG